MQKRHFLQKRNFSGIFLKFLESILSKSDSAELLDETLELKLGSDLFNACIRQCKCQLAKFRVFFFRGHILWKPIHQALSSEYYFKIIQYILFRKRDDKGRRD